MKFEWTVSLHYSLTAPMKPVQPHLLWELKAFTYIHLSHRHKCNSYLTLTKTITCWGNMLHTQIFLFHKQCETHRSPSWWFRTAHWVLRSFFSPLPHICNQRIATTNHPATGRVSALSCIATPFPWLEKNPYKLQLSNTELSPSEISLQPLQKMWESRQNKNLQTSHLWRWHGFLLVFRSVQEINFFNGSSNRILPIFSALRIHKDSSWVTQTLEPAASKSTKITPEN